MKLPPYGKYLDELLQSGKTPDNSVYLFVGQSAFIKANNFQCSRPTTLYLPAYDCPSRYRWPVKGCDILIFDTGWCEIPYLTDIAYCLYQENALVVRSISSEFKMTTYDK